MKIGDIYYMADQFLVERAGEAVKAWNWTTGRTRAELADVLNVGGTALITSGFLITEDIPFSILNGFAWGALTTKRHIDNHKQDELELDENDVIPPFVKKNRDYDYYKTYGKVSTGGAGFEFALGVGFEEVGFEIVGMGIGAFSASGYVMRSDYNPPKRKDCVRRGINKLAEIVKEATAPKSEPVLIQNYLAMEVEE